MTSHSCRAMILQSGNLSVICTTFPVAVDLTFIDFLCGNKKRKTHWSSAAIV